MKMKNVQILEDINTLFLLPIAKTELKTDSEGEKQQCEPAHRVNFFFCVESNEQLDWLLSLLDSSPLTEINSGSFELPTTNRRRQFN